MASEMAAVHGFTVAIEHHLPLAFRGAYPFDYPKINMG
ncbi:hypothetical protein YPPY11_4320 [Yersinia pestis PY-11]|nr:hypothetical protein YPPY11_4320 [Yersinia pestis PY-11]